MRKVGITLVLMIVASVAFGQLRYVQDMNRISGGALTSFKGSGFYMQYDRFLKKGLAVGVNMNYENSLIGHTNYNEIRFSTEVKYNLVEWNNMFLNGYFGLAGEIMNLSSDIESRVENKGLYGNNFGIECEYYLFDLLSLNLKAGQRVYYINGNTNFNSLIFGVSYSFY